MPEQIRRRRISGNVTEAGYVDRDAASTREDRYVSGRSQSVPIVIEAAAVADMESMGIDPALIYAFQHTGMMVMGATLDLYSDQQLLGWQSAVDRYRSLIA